MSPDKFFHQLVMNIFWKRCWIDVLGFHVKQVGNSKCSLKTARNLYFSFAC